MWKRIVIHSLYNYISVSETLQTINAKNVLPTAWPALELLKINALDATPTSISMPRTKSALELANALLANIQAYMLWSGNAQLTAQPTTPSKIMSIKFVAGVIKAV
jgi:hypothetical protein